MNGTGWTDLEIRDVEQDGLKFGQYSEVLSDIARTADTPLTIGIFGPWGSGKTSLMRLVEQALPQKNADQPPITVWFNAWHYDKEAALWRALVVRVLSALRPDIPEDGEASAEEKALIAQLDELESRLYRAVEREELGGVTVEWDKLLKGSVLGTVHLGLSLIPGLAAFSKLIEKGQEKVAGDDISLLFDAFQREKRNIYRAHIQSMEQFRDDFQKLVQAQVVKKGKRLVVFIDDLDRCLPEKGIEVLEALKLFLDAEGCVFFLGADREVIQRGIQVKYQGFLVDSDDPVVASRRIPISGDDYLEKIIQLPFHLLPLNEDRVRVYIKKCGHEVDEECAKLFALGMEANPRKVKRALNIFRLLTELAKARQGDFTLDGKPVDMKPQLLAKVVIIQSRYRALYQVAVEAPDFLVYLERAFRGDLAADEVVDGRFARWLADFEGYLPLRRMLRAGNTFGELDPRAVKLYLYLAHSTDESGVLTDAEAQAGQWWQALLSQDAGRIQRAVRDIQEAGVADEFRQRLVDALMQRSGRVGQYSWMAYLSMGQALAWLDDPRDFTEMVSWQIASCPLGERGNVESVEGFRIGRYLVTNGQYHAFLAAHPKHPVPDHWDDARRIYPDGMANYPVVCVSWEDARAYCDWQRKRLPQAREWETAVRGKEGWRYPFGNELEGKWGNTAEAKLGGPSPVGAFPDDRSPLGVIDMAGNVSEWTLTSGKEESTYVVKGGNWQEPLAAWPAWREREMAKGEKSSVVGFRVVE